MLRSSARLCPYTHVVIQSHIHALYSRTNPQLFSVLLDNIFDEDFGVLHADGVNKVADGRLEHVVSIAGEEAFEHVFEQVIARDITVIKRRRLLDFYTREQEPYARCDRCEGGVESENSLKGGICVRGTFLELCVYYRETLLKSTMAQAIHAQTLSDR